MPQARAPHYWLVKSEPDVFSIDDLAAAPRQTTPWDGVRNYQARNLMRDGMKEGDLILYYHSNAKPPGVAGIARVASSAYPDATQFDKKSKYFDPKSSPDDPRWLLVDIRFQEKLPRLVSLDEIKANAELAEMVLVKRSRLSVQPVTQHAFETIVKMARS